jgi:Helix-turn-helix domain
VIPRGARPRGVERERLADDLAARYRGGQNLSRIAHDAGCSPGLVRRLLLETGVAMRPRGGNNNPDGARRSLR